MFVDVSVLMFLSDGEVQCGAKRCCPQSYAGGDGQEPLLWKKGREGATSCGTLAVGMLEVLTGQDSRCARRAKYWSHYSAVGAM